MALIGSLGENNLTALSASISNTATSVFVYDTSSDSDGGAWRKRTQHLSWYNETLNTATRGSRQEFPAVAVIVSETSKVIIYDGDDPDMPMWMEFSIGSYSTGGVLAGTPTGIGYNNNGGGLDNHNISSVAMINGYLFIGGDTNVHAGWDVNFITDVMHEYLNYPTSATAVTKWKLAGNVAERNASQASTSVPSSRYRTTGNSFLKPANDVAMTVLATAPIDPDTGLPVPTVAIASQKGVSILTDTGTTYDLTPESHPSYDDIKNFMKVAFTKENHIVLTDRQTASGYTNIIYLPFYEYDQDLTDAYTSLPNSYNYVWNGVIRSVGTDIGYWDRTSTSKKWDYLTTTSDDIIVANGNESEYTSGITRIGTYPNQLLINKTANDYNTGWMHGYNVGTFLCDTDSTNVTGTELITNGDFSNGLTGWTVTQNGTGSVTVNGSNQVVVTSASNSTNLGEIRQNVTITRGVDYIYSFTIVSGNIYSGGLVPNNRGVGTYQFVINEPGTGTATYQIWLVPPGWNGTFTVDNFSLRRAERDRSAFGESVGITGWSGNSITGLAVYGTITKTPVATGADLVAYSGFSNSNYLKQPYNSGLDFGTDDFYVMYWSKNVGRYETIFSYGNNSSTSGSLIVQTGGNAGGDNDRVFINGVNITSSSNGFPKSVWHLRAIVRRSGTLYFYTNGVQYYSTSGGGSIGNASNSLQIGVAGNATSSHAISDDTLDNGSIALLRVGKSAPTVDQLKKMYEDEKHLFRENSKCTIYGSSNAVTALAHDKVTDRLHVGTSSGRSEFQGLRRINNTTTAVTTAISAYDSFVVEQ